MVPRSCATRWVDRRDVVAVLDEQVRAEHAGEATQGVELLLLLGGRVVVGDPQDVELGAESLGRAPRAADDALGSRMRRDQREQALADGGGGGGVDQPVVAGTAGAVDRDALGLDLLGDLPERDLAQRGEVLDLEEVVERRRHPLGRIDLAGDAAARSATAG